MYKIKADEANKIIEAHFETKTPLFLYGTFGIGKSTIVKETAKGIAKRKKLTFVEWNKTDKETKNKIENNTDKFFIFIDERLSQYDVSDIKGLPQFNDGQESITWKIPRFVSLMSKQKAQGMILFDELNLAPPIVQSSVYQIIHDRNVGETTLSENVSIVACGNLSSDKAHTFDMPLPLRDRMSEVELEHDYKQWMKWATKNDIDVRIIAFLHYQPDKLHFIKELNVAKSTTPRGWERCSDLIKGKPDPAIEPLIAVAVGEDVAVEMTTFIELKNTLDIDGILKKPEKVKDIPEGRPDLMYSLVLGIGQRYTQETKQYKEILEVLKLIDLEFAVLCFRMMIVGKQDHFVNKVMENKVFLKEFNDKLTEVLK